MHRDRQTETDRQTILFIDIDRYRYIYIYIYILYIYIYIYIYIYYIYYVTHNKLAFCSFCRFLEYRNRSAKVSSVIGKRVISMTLGDGRNASYIWGVIRNAQLLPVFFPGWILRIYVNVNLTAPRILVRLSSFGEAIELVRVNHTILTRFSPEWWSLLVADDTSLDYFVVRSPMGRLDDRDFDAVSEWIKASGDDPYLAVHCLRDHKSHSNKPMVDGLWGGRSKLIQSLIKGSIMSWLRVTFQEIQTRQMFKVFFQTLSGLWCQTVLSRTTAFPVRNSREALHSRMFTRSVISWVNNSIGTKNRCSRKLKVTT